MCRIYSSTILDRTISGVSCVVCTSANHRWSDQNFVANRTLLQNGAKPERIKYWPYWLGLVLLWLCSDMTTRPGLGIKQMLFRAKDTFILVNHHRYIIIDIRWLLFGRINHHQSFIYTVHIRIRIYRIYWYVPGLYYDGISKSAF